MRTKTLLCAAAALAAGLASSVAQTNVYSLNVVGYANVTIPANKWAIVSTPLNFTGTGGNNITNVVGGTIADGTFLYPWSSGSFLDAEQYFDGFGWFPGEATLPPGSAYFVKTPSGGGATLTFVGEVMQGNTTNALDAGFTLTGSKVPQSIPVGAAGVTSPTTTMVFPAADGDKLFFYDVTTQAYKDAVDYFAGYGWFDPGPGGPGPTEGPSPAVAEGFFSFKGAAANWVRNFTVQ